ncbi:hypothetical protein E4U19_002930 [Claviceps sp. Clav32 group G5]|nr:hypothetical protein E4U19_002930 [Claviceps sp. Clav32 group G5]
MQQTTDTQQFHLKDVRGMINEATGGPAEAFHYGALPVAKGFVDMEDNQAPLEKIAPEMDGVAFGYEPQGAMIALMKYFAMPHCAVVSAL